LTAGGGVRFHFLIEDRSLFLSSCTRREMARRRPHRRVLRTETVLVVLLIAAALGAFIAARGGL
jgi:hypothetical protein